MRPSDPRVVHTEPGLCTPSLATYGQYPEPLQRTIGLSSCCQLSTSNSSYKRGSLHKSDSRRDTPFPIKQCVDIAWSSLAINSEQCVVTIMNILQAVPYDGDIGRQELPQILKRRLETGHANVTDALGYSYNLPLSVISPDYDRQDENSEMLHGVRNSFSGILTNPRKVDARGGTFNDVGQNQYNYYVFNGCFASNMKQRNEPDVHMEWEQQQDQQLMDVGP